MGAALARENPIEADLVIPTPDSGTPAAIQLPRKPAAIRGVPAGSVIIAGPQCIVTTLLMPAGWWVLGRSPTRILTGDEDQPFLFDVGDAVRMRRIGRDDYERKARREDPA